MKSIMDKLKIITLKDQGHSNREVAKIVKCNRKTVGVYWNEYLKNKNSLTEDNLSNREIQEKMVSKPKYDAGNRGRIKFTEEIEEKLKEIITEELKKDKLLGDHKQQLTKKQIHNKIIAAGFDISISTITNEVNRLRKKAQECFIRQNYDYGDRLEYDFGEVKLVVNGKVTTYHMAVLSSPGGKFRWAYLYTNQKKMYLWIAMFVFLKW